MSWVFCRGRFFGVRMKKPANLGDYPRIKPLFQVYNRL